MNRKRRGQEVGVERGGDARRWSWERGRSGGSPEKGEEDDRKGGKIWRFVEGLCGRAVR